LAKANPSQFADFGLTTAIGQVPGTEEQGYLQEGVVKKVQQGGCMPARCEKGSPETHVSELANCGVSQAALKIILAEGQDGAQDNGYDHGPTEQLPEARIVQDSATKNITQRSEEAKNTRIYNRHGM